MLVPVLVWQGRLAHGRPVHVEALRHETGGGVVSLHARCFDVNLRARHALRRVLRMTLADQGHIDIDGARLEYRMIGPRPDAAPTIVMLHEGLGSVSTWGAFPETLSEKTGAGVFVYSRAGYGRSSTVTLPRPLDYMQREAADVLPQLFDAIGFRRGILLGHS